MPGAILNAYLKSATPIRSWPAPAISFRNGALLFVCCVLFHIAGTWRLPLIDRDEPRFAEASREMIERGDYVVPYFNNHVRFDKPPLTYWAQTASYQIFGETDFAARFPSVIAAALTALVIFAWGSRMRPAGGAPALQPQSGANIGFSAALIFTLCLQTFVHAKAAVADMWLVLFVTTGHWAGWEMLFGEVTRKRSTFNPPTQGFGVAGVQPASAMDGLRRGERSMLNESREAPDSMWWWIFYISLALAFLAKGPIGFISLLTVGLFAIVARPPDLLRRFGFARGLTLTIVLVAAWAVPACIQTSGEFLRVGIGRHVIGRSIGAMEGHGASSLLVYALLLPFYFVTVFLSFFPWSIKLPWLTRKVWQQWDALDQYLVCGVAVTFAIFTLVATKLPHYTLPAFPLLALLLARHWSRSESTSAGRPADVDRDWFRTIAMVITCLWLAAALIVPPLVARFFPAYTLFQQASHDLRPAMEFGAVEYNEPSLVWYFRSRVKGFMTPLNKNSAVEFMREPGARFVIVPNELLNTIATNRSQNWKLISTHGFNLAKGRSEDLTLALKPE